MNPYILNKIIEIVEKHQLYILPILAKKHRRARMNR
jgi:hypothetical protein